MSSDTVILSNNNKAINARVPTNSQQKMTGSLKKRIKEYDTSKLDYHGQNSRPKSVKNSPEN
jgi:hypothetical protein